MAAYNWDITAAEVIETIAFAEAASIEPASTTLDKWVTRFSAEINVILAARGITPASVTVSSNADLYELVRQKVIGRVVAEWWISNQGSETAMSEYYEGLVEDFRLFIAELRDRPNLIANTSAVPSFDESAEEKTVYDIRGRVLDYRNEFS